MADSYIQVPPDSTGKKLDAEQLTVGSNTVERERMQVAGAADDEIARVQNSNPDGTEHAVVVRSIEAVPTTIVSGGRLTNGTPGTAIKVVGSATPCRHATICAPLSNGAQVAIGNSSCKATDGSEEGVLLAPGSSYDLAIDDLSKVYFDAQNTSDAITFNTFN